MYYVSPFKKVSLCALPQMFSIDVLILTINTLSLAEFISTVSHWPSRLLAVITV